MDFWIHKLFKLYHLGLYCSTWSSHADVVWWMMTWLAPWSSFRLMHSVKQLAGDAHLNEQAPWTPTWTPHLKGTRPGPPVQWQAICPPTWMMTWLPEEHLHCTARMETSVMRLGAYNMMPNHGLSASLGARVLGAAQIRDTTTWSARRRRGRLAPTVMWCASP